MITSYAQNFEDVILWRALKSVERGFYIDIGAQDPVVDSVSLSFYEQGWRGMHVEPAAAYATKLRGARPDEDVIEAAIGTGTGLLAFHEFPGTGLSTGDPAIASQHAEAGFEMKEHLVPVISLQSVLDRCAEREVHWLKIDVEGMEAAVIESWGSSIVRPWIVVVESTVPLSSETSHEAWDPRLQRLGYEFVYFDGLNRFYVSKDHAELKAAFGPGPNFFDEFAFSASSTSGVVAPIRQQLEEMEEKKAEVEKRLEIATAEAVSLNDRLVSLEADLQDAKAAYGDAGTSMNDSVVSLAEQLKDVLREKALAARDAEISHLRQRIADAYIVNTNQLALKEAAVSERDVEIDRLHRHIDDADIANANQQALNEAAIRERDVEVARLNEKVAALEGQVPRLITQTDAFLASTSWRLTHPLRWFKTSTSWFARGMSASLTFKQGSRSWRMSQRLVMSLVRFTLSRPLLAQRARRVLSRLPKTEANLRVILSPNGESPPIPPMTSLSMSSRHADQILFRLKVAVARADKAAD